MPYISTLSRRQGRSNSGYCLAFAANHQSREVVDGAGGAMIAGDPLRVFQGDGSRVHGDL